MAHRAEHLVTLGDGVGSEGAHPFEAETLDVETREDAAVDDGFAQQLEGDVASLRGEPASEAACEGVARAGRVVDVFERVGGAGEKPAVAKKQAAVFAFFDGDVFRAERTDGGTGFDEAGEAGELAGFAIVQDEHVHALEQREEVVFGDVDPEIHRVGDDEFRARHLVEDVALQTRADVREEDVRRGVVSGGKRRGEVLEDVQLDAAGFAGVEIPHVFARPTEGFALRDLQAGEVDVAALEILEVRWWEVVADDADHVHRREKARTDRRVRSGAAEEIGVLFHRSFDGIERDGTNDEDGHRALEMVEVVRVGKYFLNRFHGAASGCRGWLHFENAETQRRRDRRGDSAAEPLRPLPLYVSAFQKKTATPAS